jgi:glycosyltransferase involved in cell wall biosynthesis
MVQVDVSFIVPAQGRALIVDDTLDSILSQVTKFTYEIIVIVDNCEQVKKNPNVKVIKSQKLNASIARNLGIREAKGTFLAFVDSDTILAPNWLETLILKLQSGPWIGCQGEIIVSAKKRGTLFSAFRDLSSVSSKNGLVLAEYPLPVLNSAACIYWNRKEVIFNESISSAEDIELSWRLFTFTPGGFCYVRGALATSYFCPEAFAPFLMRNFRLGFWLGKIIKRYAITDEFFFHDMRLNILNEFNTPSNLSPKLIRLISSLATYISASLSSLIRTRPYIKALSFSSGPMIRFNGRQLNSFETIITLGHETRIVNISQGRLPIFEPMLLLNGKENSFMLITEIKDDT